MEPRSYCYLFIGKEISDDLAAEIKESCKDSSYLFSEDDLFRYEGKDYFMSEDGMCNQYYECYMFIDCDDSYAMYVKQDIKELKDIIDTDYQIICVSVFAN